VIVLAAVGATGGWLLGRADRDNQAAAGAGSSPPGRLLSPSPAFSSPASEVPSYAEPSQSEPDVPSAGGFPLPNVVGTDFVEARQRLRELRLGVQVEFDGDGDGRTVQRTRPAPGHEVHPGITVRLQVQGEPPTLQVPRLVGMSCLEAGRLAADSGLVPRYKPRKVGRVTRQDPRPYATARWNDKVTLVCEGWLTD
jgi:hypothetical protein